jgi:hypothetical protein
MKNRMERGIAEILGGGGTHQKHQRNQRGLIIADNRPL